MVVHVPMGEITLGFHFMVLQQAQLLPGRSPPSTQNGFKVGVSLKEVCQSSSSDDHIINVGL